MSKLSHKVASLLDSGLAKHKSGDLAGAAEDYEKVLKRSPSQPDALWLRGLVYLQSGAPHEAVQNLEKAAKFRRKDAGILNDLGMALEAIGDADRARSAFREAVQSDPHHASALVNSARYYLIDGNATAALEAADKAIEVQGFMVEAHNVRGSALHRLGRLKEGLEAYAAALAMAPNDVDVLLSKALLLHDMTSYGEARVASERVVGLAEQGSRQWADAQVTLGLIESDQGRPTAAIAFYDQVIDTVGEHVAAYVNRGVAKERIGDVGAATADYAAAAKLDPLCHEALYYLGRLKLLQGRWEEGWIGYENRWHVSSYVSERRDRGLPEWNGGQPSSEQKVLIWGEQGLGDQILFARMLEDACAHGVDAVVEIDPRLVPLVPSLAEKVPVYGYDAVPENVLSQCQSQLPICSLGRFLRPSQDSFPAAKPYLQADSHLVEDFIAKYKASAEGKLKIGIAWHSVNPSFGEAKSLALESWAPILQATDAFFVSVQYGETQQEIDTVEKEMGIQIHADRDFDPFVNLAHAAAQIASLDLVIATSNTAVHLAGALGKETWVMVPHVPEWRWGLSGDTSIWYPNVRIFRQDQPGQWAGVVAQVAEALAVKR